MRRDDLTEAIRRTLTRLPPPHASHYGVVPPAPPEGAISLGDYHARYELALRRLAEAEALAGDLKHKFLITRLLMRREAVSSSAIEGANSTLDELLHAEETEGGDETTATKQVRNYAQTLE